MKFCGSAFFPFGCPLPCQSLASSFAHSAQAHAPDRVVERLVADLDARGIDARPTASPLTDIAWIDRLHEIYYPPIVVADSG